MTAGQSVHSVRPTNRPTDRPTDRPFDQPTNPPIGLPTNIPTNFVIYYSFQKSHMVQPGVCYNGCCRSQPCMNGGTCVEHCHTPKQKFTWTCPSAHVGTVCENKLTSWVDVLQAVAVGQTPPNGVYNVSRAINGKMDIFPLYCAFSSPNNAWTLIESFSLANITRNVRHFTPAILWTAVYWQSEILLEFISK